MYYTCNILICCAVSLKCSVVSQDAVFLSDDDTLFYTIVICLLTLLLLQPTSLKVWVEYLCPK